MEGRLAVEARSVDKRFGAQHVLRSADLCVPSGSLSVLAGPSGTGKSVLIRLLVGLMKPDRGTITVHGREIAGLRRSELLTLRNDIGVMFQDGALFSSMSVYDNVAFPLRQHTNLSEAEIRDLVHAQLAAVGLGSIGNRFPKELSGGMRKRAGLARAVILDPSILICDEPDSGLDPVRTALLGELLIERHAALGGTMLVVTHDIGLTRLISDHVSILWKGEIVESGPAESIWSSDNPFVQQFFAGAVEGPLTMDAA